jgi:hypothetical protein
MKRLTSEKFIIKSNKIHNYIYDYSNVKYKTTHVKVKIKCKIHGYFEQTPASHLQGRGCILCGIESIKLKERYKTKDFILSAKKIHRNIYDYGFTNYVNAHTHVIVTCYKHGNFNIQPYNHLNDRGCPKCKISKGELKIINFLDDNKISYIHQATFEDCKNPKTNRKLKFDFYIASKNLLIEYDGDHHFQKSNFHGHVLTQLEFDKSIYRDGLKNQYAKDHGIKLLRIKRCHLNKIEQILKEIILVDI